MKKEGRKEGGKKQRNRKRAVNSLCPAQQTMQSKKNSRAAPTRTDTHALEPEGRRISSGPIHRSESVRGDFVGVVKNKRVSPTSINTDSFLDHCLFSLFACNQSKKRARLVDLPVARVDRLMQVDPDMTGLKRTKESIAVVARACGSLTVLLAVSFRYSSCCLLFLVSFRTLCSRFSEARAGIYFKQDLVL